MTADAVNKLVGEQIRAPRLHAGLTQAKLAERSEVAFETISRIERGTMNTTIRTLVAIAGALGVAPGDLLAGASPRPGGLDDSLQAVIDPLLDQPPRVRAAAARLIRALVDE